MIHIASYSKLLFVLFLGFFLAACATAHDDPYNSGRATQSWTQVGAILGGVVGSAFGQGDGKLAATAAGVLVGAVAGNVMGAGIDEERAAQDAEAWDPLRQGTIEDWPAQQDEDSQDSSIGAPYNQQGEKASSSQMAQGSSSAQRQISENNAALETEDGRPCRFLPTLILIEGVEQEATARYCRQKNGRWQIEP